jgi:hypothetical protein
MVALLCGCVPRQGVVDVAKPRGYFGPTESMEQVIEAINRNNTALPTLWSRFEFDAVVVDENGKRHPVNGDTSSILLYRKPSEFRLVGKKNIAGPVFEVGTTADRFWLTVSPPGESTRWWGHYRNLGKPCAQPIPIRPDAVMEVLGIADIPADNLLNTPAPTMRFNSDADAYMIVWNEPTDTKWVARKEIWYDRQTKLPILVSLFDDNGKIILRAYLGNHVEVKVDGVNPSPKVATTFDLFFPENKTKMLLKLDKPMLQNRGVPNANTIQFPTDAGVTNEIQIDAGCTD